MTAQSKHHLIAGKINQLLKNYYARSQAEDSEHEKQREFINGFMAASLIGGLIDKDSLEQLIASAHQEVCGVSISQKHFDQMMTGQDDSFFDIPTMTRQAFRK